MHCVLCENDVAPTFDLGINGRIVPMCPKCCIPIVQTNRVEAHADGSVQVATEQVATAKPKASAKPPAVVETPDILAMAKARLESIEAQLAVMRKLEAEAVMLRRMIWAATPDEQPS